MRVLVVGARGFVGVALTGELLRRGHSVTAIEVRGDKGRLTPLADRIDWVTGDCADPEVILGAIGRDGVDAVYYGPYYRSPSAAKNLHAEFQVMGVGALNIFNLTRALGIRRVVFPSSTAVHGIQDAGSAPVHELSRVRPFGVYGATKLACEYLAAEVNEDLGRNAVTSVRLPSIYGPGADIASRKVNVLAVQAARGNVGQVDYVPDARVCIAHVADTAHFLADLMEAAEVRHDVYELGGLSVTFGAIAQAVSQAVPDARHQFGTDTLSPLPSEVDWSRARGEFALTHRDLADGMASIVAYERARAAGREAVRP